MATVGSSPVLAITPLLTDEARCGIMRMMPSVLRLCCVIALHWLIAGGLSACAVFEARGPETATGVPATAPEVLRHGYGAIVDRSLDVVNAETVGMQGISGLLSLDPRLSLRPEGEALKLRFDRRRLASVPMPRPGNVEEWARATAEIWAAAAGASPILAQAPPESVYRAIFQAVTATLDPASRYTSATDARGNRRRREGALGIGVAYTLDDGFPRVTEVQERGPAARAGLRVGDMITAIDGDPSSSLTPEQIADMLIDGPEGLVTLTVQRPRGAAGRFVMRRTRTVPETVSVEILDGVVIARVARFNQGTADSLAAHLQAARRQLRGRPRGLVLDLRGDPGGLLQQAVRVADLFLKDGPIVVTRGRGEDSGQRYEASGPDILEGAPMIVLIDGETASASEILAAALQRRERALIAGTASFGKGTVQTVVSLPNGGDLTLTTARVMPAGLDWPSVGVQPDLCFSGVRDDASLETLAQPRAAAAAIEDGHVPCPPERRDQRIDLELARRILLDNQLLARLRQQSLAPTSL